MKRTSFPIPENAWDDRLAFVGTSGSGKTYAAGTAIEHVLSAGGRVGIIDPLGVWWGLRLRPDGNKPSGLDVVIFGGPHGDLPLTDSAGALLGETAATMRESFIVDLTGIRARTGKSSKAQQRIFMRDFLVAFEAHAQRDPVHLVFDEADMFAPQRVMDRDGDALKLLGQVEDIVRRGRVLGFIPWLITQRPAVLNKDVLSQADGLVAMKLTSSQDRDALGAWIDNQADRAAARELLGALPSFQVGESYVWLPGRGVMRRTKFPAKFTFDSSRTPKRGEVVRQVKLAQLDVDALRAKLGSVEAEIKQNDPKALRARVAELERQVKAAEFTAKNAATANAKTLAPANGADVDEAWRNGTRAGVSDFAEWVLMGIDKQVSDLKRAIERFRHKPELLVRGHAGVRKIGANAPGSASRVMRTGVVKLDLPHADGADATPAAKRSAPRGRVVGTNHEIEMGKDGVWTSVLKPVHIRVLDAINFWNALGFPTPRLAQVAVAARYSLKSSGFDKALSHLSANGYITRPAPGCVTLTDTAPSIDVPRGVSVREKLSKVLKPVHQRVLDAIPKDKEIAHEDLAEGAGYSAKSSGFDKALSHLSSLGLITRPRPGYIAVESWVHLKLP